VFDTSPERGDSHGPWVQEMLPALAGQSESNWKEATSAEEYVWVYLCDLPAFHVIEYGQVMCPPGEEDAWFATLPKNIK
jgi:hypothetical protein